MRNHTPFATVLCVALALSASAERSYLEISEARVNLEDAEILLDPVLSQDGLRLYAAQRLDDKIDPTSSRVSNGIVMRQRESLSQAFGPVRGFPGIQSSKQDRAPWVSADGLTLLLASTRDGGKGGSDLYLYTWNETNGLYGDARPIPSANDSVNTAANESFPCLSDDGLVLYFASDREGGRGGWDIYYATRDAADKPFGAPRALSGANSAWDEYTPRLDRDGQTLYLTRGTMGEAKTERILVCTLAGGGASEPLELAELNCVNGASGAAPSGVGSFIYLRDGVLTEAKGDVAKSVRREEIAAGFLFPEGPAFDPEGNLVFSACNSKSIVRVNRDGRIETYVNTGSQPNGVAFDREGNLYTADAPLDAVLKVLPDRSFTVFADHVGDHKFLSPNDLVFDRDGNLYCTDPVGWTQDVPTGYVYRIAPNGSVEIVLEGLLTPNGVQLNKAQDTLYVCSTKENRVVRVSIDRNGKLGKMVTHAEVPAPDGMSVDRLGNIYVASYADGAVFVFDPDGELLARLHGGSRNTTNVCFGPADDESIYVTSPGEGVVSRMLIGIPGQRLYCDR